MQEQTDRRRIRDILARGDESAFRELYRGHTPRLFQFILRLLGGDELEAENLVQETWVRASENLGRFRGEARFATWLTGIGLNVVRDQMRRRGRDPLELVNSADISADIVTAPRPLAERIDLERAIALLPAGYRIVLVLHDVEGMKHAEIATQLRIAVGTSKSQLSKARRLLRGSLADPEEKSHVRK